MGGEIDLRIRDSGQLLQAALHVEGAAAAADPVDQQKRLSAAVTGVAREAVFNQRVREDTARRVCAGARVRDRFWRGHCRGLVVAGVGFAGQREF